MLDSIEPLSDIDDPGHQLRFVIFRTGKGNARPLFKIHGHCDATPMTGFTELHQSESR